MKKIFTLIAVAMMAVGGAMAQTSKYWDLATWETTSVTSEVTVDGLTYYGEGKSAYSSGDAKITVDDTELNFTGRIKMGGASTFQEGKKNSRVFAFEAKAGQIIYVFGTHGSSSGDARTFYLSMTPSSTKNDASTAFGLKALEANEKGYLTATVPSDGTVYLWADNNNGIYAISVGYSISELANIQAGGTGIADINADVNDADAPAYNLAGQRVNANAKGLVIKNGKKYVNK